MVKGTSRSRHDRAADAVGSGDVVRFDLGKVGHEFVVGGDFAENVEADIPGREVAFVVEEVGGEADAEGF